jgi:hypothetical protein
VKQAAIGKNMSPDKVARLEAIRAAKRGAGGVPGTDAGAPSDEALQGQPVAEAETHMSESNAGAAPAAAPSQPQAAIGQNMSDEKRARLEAIRAAKRAERGEG